MSLSFRDVKLSVEQGLSEIDALLLAEWGSSQTSAQFFHHSSVRGEKGPMPGETAVLRQVVLRGTSPLPCPLPAGFLCSGNIVLD